MDQIRYCFIAEWYDSQACFMRSYQLMYYPSDNSIELYEIKTKRHFLKRSKQEAIELKDLYVGSTVTILSRTMKIISYGDQFTQRALEKNQEKSIGILFNGHMSKLGHILDSVYKNELKIVRIKRVQLATQEAIDTLQSQRDRVNYTSLINALSEQPIIIMELLGINASSKWNDIIGKGDLVFDLQQDALNHLLNGVASNKLGTNTATYVDSTCCIIKPHLVAAGMAGAVVYEIQKAGFEISAIQTFNFSKPNAEEFLEVYKGVVHEYASMVDELLSGMCIALEVRAQNAAQVFREFCGPSDPEIGRTLRPKTLRAMFGIDKIKNGVHCTDLPEDAPLEVEYFFRILDQ